MLGKTATESMAGEEISKAIDPLASEASKRELEASRFRKASLVKSGKRDPRRPSCRRHFSDSSRTPLSPSEPPPKKTRGILTLMAPGRPDWVATCGTYKGRIAKDAYLEAAFDSAGKGFCRLCAEKSGTPTRDVALSALGDRIAKGAETDARRRAFAQPAGQGARLGGRLAQIRSGRQRTRGQNEAHEQLLQLP